MSEDPSGRSSPSFDGVLLGSPRKDWDTGIVRPVAFDRLGQRYRRDRLADPVAEDAMAGSLRRWGQLSPVVACRRAGPEAAMNEATRHEIVQRHQQGTSIRSIAMALGISRRAVARVLAE